MNSMSKGYYDSCGKGKEERKEEKCPTIIKCSTPVTTAVNLTATDQTLASIKLNTSCLDDPCVKVDFTGDVTINGGAGGGTGTVTIQVEKVCRHETTEIGPERTLAVTLAADGTTTIPISLFACDCPCKNTCNCDDYCDWVDDCCIYRVVANVAGTGTGPVTASVNDYTLGAIATCKNSCCKKPHHGKCHQY